VILHARAKLLREEFERAIDPFLAEQGHTSNPILSGPAFRLWTFLSLWWAYLYVVIEGYRESYTLGHPLSDPEIDPLLQSEYTEKLRLSRNKIFHPNFYDHRAIGALFQDHRPVLSWAEELTDSFGRLLRKEVKDDPRSSTGST